MPIIDFALIWPGVVGALKNGLNIQRNWCIAGNQRNGDLRQSLVEPDWIDEEIFQVVKVVNRDVILELAGDFDETMPWHRRGVLSAAKQIDLYQMDLAVQDFALLAEVQIAAMFARRLVAKTKQLDAGH